MPLEFESVPITDVLAFFSNITDIQIVLHPSLEERNLETWEVPEIDLRADVPLGVALQLILDLTSPPEVGNLTWFIRDDEPLITADPLLPTLLAFDAVPLAETLDKLRTLTGSKITLDEPALEAADIDPAVFREATISLVLPSGRRLSDALRSIAHQAHPEARVSMTPDGDYLITAGDGIE